MTLGRDFKMPGDAVFEEKAGWRGATKENTLHGSSTEEQKSRAAFSSKILRTAGLLAGSFVVVAVIARYGDTPATPADDRHHSLPAKIPRRRTPAILKSRPSGSTLTVFVEAGRVVVNAASLAQW